LTDDDLLFRSGELFTTGVSEYFDLRPGIQEPQSRIYVQILPEGAKQASLALLDTGGLYTVLNTALASSLRGHLTGGLGEVGLRTAYGVIRGELYTHRITLIAEAGQYLDIESTVFVSPEWNVPSFLGYTGALDRVRFAIDPSSNRFYFGPLA
jgi:hypothetical protein